VCRETKSEVPSGGVVGGAKSEVPSGGAVLRCSGGVTKERDCEETVRR
jgi:hypothetical protein